jgi:hypothetical protein
MKILRNEHMFSKALDILYTLAVRSKNIFNYTHHLFLDTIYFPTTKIMVLYLNIKSPQQTHAIHLCLIQDGDLDSNKGMEKVCIEHFTLSYTPCS